MVREQILVQDFEKISRKYDYYLWNFVWKGEGMCHSMRTIFDESSEDIESSNHLKYFLEVFDIPYFESYIQDSMDFLDVLGVPLNNLRIMLLILLLQSRLGYRTASFGGATPPIT